MKIVTAVNAMINNPQLISRITPSKIGNEYFFMYMDRYKWSVSSSHDGYSVFYYPTEIPLEQLAAFDEEDWQDFPDMMRYSSKEIGTKEATESFAELFSLVKAQRFNMDAVLTKIIESDLPF